MAKRASRRRIWTAEHVRTLKKMAHQKKRASHIAKRLKRTEGATSKRRSVWESRSTQGLDTCAVPFKGERLQIKRSNEVILRKRIDI